MLEIVEKFRIKAEEYFKARDVPTLSFSFDVGSVMYRVFKKLPQKPSLVFKKWAFVLLKNEIFLLDLKGIKDKEDFKRIHLKYVQHLNDFWKIEEKQELKLAHNLKLIDLFFKSLSKCNFDCEVINQILLKYANLPLDSITFPLIDEISNDKFKLSGKTMGVITTYEMYNQIQNIVYDFSLTNGVYPIYLDYIGQQRQILEKDKYETITKSHFQPKSLPVKEEIPEVKGRKKLVGKEIESPVLKKQRLITDFLR